MYRNLLAGLGHTWIEDIPLSMLKTLQSCYIVEVTISNGYKHESIPISQITGKERNVDWIDIYYKSKEQDKSPYHYYVDHKVTYYIIQAFLRDCEDRHRGADMVELRNFMPTEYDLKAMRKQLKKRMLEVFESGDNDSDDDLICYRNEYEPLRLIKMLEFLRQADPDGIDIFISFNIANADADQIERTLNDLETIDATIENEPQYKENISLQEVPALWLGLFLIT